MLNMANVIASGLNGSPPLPNASKKGNLEITRLLIKSGTDIDMIDEVGSTALHYGAEYGHVDIVKYLIAAGARMSLKDKHGKTALVKGAENGHADVVKEFIAAGDDVNTNNGQKVTALQCSSAEGYVEIVKILISAGAYIDMKDIYGKTALHKAAENGILDIVKTLIAAGAHTDLWDVYGQSAFYLAAENSHLDVVKFLVSVGADISVGKHCLLRALSFKLRKSKTNYVKYTALMTFAANKPHVHLKLKYLPHWNVCEEEIKVMRDMTLGSSSVSVFRFLMETDESRVAFYSSKDKFGLKDEFQRSKYRDKLSIYGEDFEIQFTKGIERVYLMNKAQKLMGNCLPKMLPIEIRRMISEYLTNNDLKTFLYTFAKR